ncbi:hypothetical protein [Saccharopolyspora hattusasensis]|uniref:hypothetical protein n=1 Tax=Saccharopolyspora hattusasensis TaxID=1128679 RepID=UPI003D995CD5
MPVVLPGLDPWATQKRIGEREARYALGATLTPAAGPALAGADGVLPSTTVDGQTLDLKVTADAPDPSMDLRIFAGQCVLHRPGQGPYLGTLDEPGTITLDDADPVNPRIDLVIARAYDKRLGDPTTGFVIEPLTGTPNTDPTPQAVPVGAIVLAAVVVGPGDRAIRDDTVRDLRRSTATRNGIRVLLPGDDPTEPGVHSGQSRYRDGRLETWNGQAWHTPRTTEVFETTAITRRQDQSGLAPIAAIQIPDPGGPYRLVVQASAEMTAHQCRADLFVCLDSVTAPPVAVGVGPASASQHVLTPMRTTAELIGPHKVYAVGTRLFPSGEPAVWSNTDRNANLTVLRLPV